MSEDALHFCYLDESGSELGRTITRAEMPPVFVLAGFIIPAAGAAQMTREFLAAKREYDPNRFQSASAVECLEKEVKGGALFGSLVGKGGEKQRARTLAFLRGVLDLLERLDARLVGRFRVKSLGQEFDAGAVYASCLTAIAGNFQHFLNARRARGIVWCDLRRRPAKKCEDCGKPVFARGSAGEHLIAPVSRAVFVRKFGGKTDEYLRLLECPAFADSENHAGIQIADLLCSALIAPIAAAYYRPDSPKASKRFFELRDEEGFGERMNRMQLRVEELRGALTPADGGSSAPLFRPVFPGSEGEKNCNSGRNAL